MSIETGKLDGKNIYADEYGFLHDNLAERQTVGDYIRSLPDDKLAEYIVQVTYGAVRDVFKMCGLAFDAENYSKENAVKQFVDYLQKDVNEIGRE